MPGHEFARASWRDEPAGWWGYREPPARPLSLVQLITNQTLDYRTAAFLWLAMEHRPTVVVAAPQPGAGKTTFLSALLDLVPDHVARRYLRGWYERFDFIDQDEPERTYLLCNEISSHLPIYLWGTGVRRLFELVQRGYALATTVHAASAEDVLALFREFPLQVPDSALTAIDLVLTLGMGVDPYGTLRRLVRVEVLSATGGRVTAQVVAERETLRSPLVARPGALVHALAERFAMDRARASAELARRERVLHQWVARGLIDRQAVREAARAYRRQTTTSDVVTGDEAPRPHDLAGGR